MSRTGALSLTDEGRQQLRVMLARSRSFGWATLIASLAAVALTAPALAQQPGGTLIAAFSADPAGFDPVRGPSGMSHVVIEQVYSTLMALDPDAIPIPILPKASRYRADGLDYTFKLRHGHQIPQWR